MTNESKKEYLRNLFHTAPMDGLLTRECVAAGLGLSVSFLEQRVADQNGPQYQKHGRLVRYIKQDVLDWWNSTAITARNSSDAAVKQSQLAAIQSKKRSYPASKPVKDKKLTTSAYMLWAPAGQYFTAIQDRQRKVVTGLTTDKY